MPVAEKRRRAAGGDAGQRRGCGQDMRAGEEFSELAELGSSYVGGRYGSTAFTRTEGRRSGRVPAEAEDAMGPNSSPRGHARSRSGLYYSPPGTSYTIVERPSSGMHIPRDYNAYHSSQPYNTTTSPRGKISFLSSSSLWFLSLSLRFLSLSLWFLFLSL